MLRPKLPGPPCADSRGCLRSAVAFVRGYLRTVLALVGARHAVPALLRGSRTPTRCKWGQTHISTSTSGVNAARIPAPEARNNLAQPARAGCDEQKEREHRRCDTTVAGLRWKPSATAKHNT